MTVQRVKTTLSGTSGQRNRARRQRFMKSGSAIATSIAIALAGMLASPAAAQTAGGVPSMPNPRSVMIERPVETPGPMRPGSPIMSGPQVPRISIQSNAAPVRLITPDDIRISGRATLDPPFVPATAPAVRPAVQSHTQPVMVEDIRITTPVVLPPATPAVPPSDVGSAGTGVAGINVSAYARFSDAEIGFRPGNAADIVDVRAAEAIINWTTFGNGSPGGEVSFLGEGAKLGFTSELSQYTVLNRVFTPGFDSAIRIDGSVSSSVAGGAAGGNIWFYSAGGIIVGSTGAFDVGSLVLTTSQLDTISGNGGGMRFSGVNTPGSAIVIEAGADIAATGSLAIVAPRIEQHGTVDAGGSVAYVAAEQAQLTIDNGLFDIAVLVGSEDANGIVHTGTTTGPSANVSGAPRGITMAGISKNSAMTMLVGGSVGYQAASAASVDANGRIVLSAGDSDSINVIDADLSGNVSVTAGQSIRFGASSGQSASANGDVSLKAGVEGKSGGTIDVFSNGDLNVGGNLSLDTSVSGNGPVTRGMVDISVTGAGSTLAVGGDLAVDASTSGAVGAASGEEVRISASGTGLSGGLLVGGNIAIGTSAAAGSETGVTRAGGVTVSIQDAALRFSTMVVDSKASANGSALGQTGAGRDYQGGSFTLNQSGDAEIAGDALIIDASAAGVDGKGGMGAGGKLELNIGGGDLTLSAIDLINAGIGGNGLRQLDESAAPADYLGFTDSDAFYSASGRGDLITPVEIAHATGLPSAGDGGDGIGGDMTFNLTAGSATVLNFTVNANGIGSEGAAGTSGSTNGGAGGNGIGGTATFNAIGGTLNVTDTLTVTATGNTLEIRGNGGSGSGTDGGAGGLGIGGTAIFNLDGDAVVTADIITVDATAYGGNGGSSDVFFFTLTAGFDPANDAGSGGDAIGGTATFNDIAGTLSFNNLFVAAEAFGGNGGNAQTGDGVSSIGGAGGDAVAGDASINLNRALDNLQNYVAIARSLGGTGGNGDIAGVGGDAFGGNASINVNDVSVRVNSFFIDTLAVGGAGGSSILFQGTGAAGGSGTAGTSSINISGAAGDFSTFGVNTMSASGFGGTGGVGGPNTLDFGTGGIGGVGGDGIGGTVSIQVTDGASANLVFDDEIAANARAGNGGAGGDASFTVGGVGGDAGNATGGQILIDVLGGSTLDLSSASGTLALGTIASGGSGGDGGLAGSAGRASPGLNGNATGGLIRLNTAGTGSVFNIGGSLIAEARALASLDSRADSVAGSAFGGDVIVQVGSGASFAGTSLVADVTGRGGAGENSNGDAEGGLVTVSVTGGSLSLSDLVIDAGADGGASVGDTGGNGSDGGAATGGLVNVSADSASTFILGNLDISANGFGGSGADNPFGGIGGQGGAGIGGAVSINLANDPSVGSVFIDAEGQGGAGGAGGFGANGGTGGTGRGGTIDFSAAGSGAMLSSLISLNLNAAAFGGTGGRGGNGDTSSVGGTGGTGGLAFGGAARFAVSGAGASFEFDPFIVLIGADATGGAGGSGGDNFLGFTAGNGGIGGGATGGEVAIIAGSGSSVSLIQPSTDPFGLRANGTGGAGGTGGNLDLTNGGTQGSGGDGGIGTGGSPVLRSVGGTISAGDVELTALGIGGNGGFGGDDGNATLGPQGLGGGGVGGTPTIETFDGSPGIITLGNVLLDATAIGGAGLLIGATAGGQITITDGSADPAGLITMGSLTAIATGTAAAPGTPSLTIESSSGPITVLGDVDADVAGDIIFNFDGDGQMLVGGSTTLSAGGDILLTHTNNPLTATSIDSAGVFIASAGGNFDFQSGSIINGSGLVSITAQSITFSDVLAGTNIILNATNGDITGLADMVATGFIDLDATQAISVLDADAATGFTADAGGDVAFGTVINSDGNLTVNAGGSISGVSAINDAPVGSAFFDRTVLTAGTDITLSGTAQSVDDGVFINAGGNISVAVIDAADSIQAIAGGTLSVGTAANTNAFDGIFRGTSINLDNADIQQFLTIDATAGDITGTGAISGGAIVNIDATGGIAFGSLTGTGSIDVNAGGDIVGGDVSGGALTTFDTPGSITLGDASASGFGLQVRAGTNVDVGIVSTTGGVASLNLQAGGTVDFVSANSASLLDITGTAINGGDVLGDDQVDVIGDSVNVGTVRSLSGFVFVRGLAGDVIVGDVTSDSFGVTISATGSATTGALIGSGTGVTTGGDANIASAFSRSSLTWNIGGDLTAGDITALATSPGMGVTVGGDAIVGDVSSNGLLNWDVGGALTGGNFFGNSLTTLDAASVDLASVDTNNSGTVTTTSGDALIGSISSRLSFNVFSAGLADIDLVQPTLDSLIRGTSVIVGDVATGRNLRLDATAGSATISGTVSTGGLLDIDATDSILINSATPITAGGIIDLDAGVDINFQSLTSTGTFNANAGGDITFSAANSSAGMNFVAGGSILGGAIDTGGAGDTTFTADAAVVLDDIVTRILTISAGTDLTVGNVDAIGRDIRGIAIDLDANGTASFGALTSGRGININAVSIAGGDIVSDNGVTISASDIAVGSVAVIENGGILLDALMGDLVSGDLTSTTFGIVARSTESVTTGNLLVNGTANASDITVSAGTDANIGDATAGNGLSITAGGNLVAGNLFSNLVSPGTPISVGGDAAIASFDASAGSGAISVGGALTGGSFSANGVLTINAGSVDIASAVSDTQSVTIDAASGDALVGNTDSAFSTAVTAAGLAQVGNAVTGTGFTIRGASASLDSGSITGDLVWEATAGNIDGSGAISVGGAIDLDATGNIGFGSLNAQGGAFTVDAGGDIAFGGASSNASIIFNAGGAVSGGDLTATNAVTVGANSIALGDVAAGNIALTSATDLLFNLLSSPNAISLSASNGLIGANTGAGDIESGGDVTLLSQSIDVGDVTSGGAVDATATAGDAGFGVVDAATSITIAAAGTPMVGGIITGGNASITGDSVTLGASDIGGSLLLDAQAGDILLQLDGAEQIRVGGATTLNAAQDITVVHTNNAAGTISLDSGFGLIGSAQGNIDAQQGSILSAIEIILLSGGSLTADDLRAAAAISIQSGGSVLLNNALATGPQGISNLRGISIDAGLNPFGSSAYDNLANVRITGAVDSYASVSIRSGGSTIFEAGSSTAANDRIFVQTGDDIIVGTGAALTSARSPLNAPDPADPFNGVGAIDLDAGGLTNLLSIPATPLASIVIDGTLNANGAAIIATGNAIDGLDGDFIASSIALDINDAPADGVTQSDDAGLLSANCLQGNICIGNIEADNVIEIGQQSNNDVIQLIIEQGSVDANDILITTRNDIVMGTNGIATQLSAANLFSATSISGNVNLFDADISSTQIIIDAAGSLLGNAALTSSGDIGITVGLDVNAASLVAGGEITSAADVGEVLEGFFAVPGSIRVGTISVGSGNLDFSAGGDIVVGTVTVPGSDILFAAGGLAQLDAANSAINISLDGGSVIFGDVSAAGNISAVSASSIDFGALVAGGAIDLAADGAIAGTGIDAVGDVTMIGSSALIAEILSGGTISIGASAGDIDVANMIADGSIFLDADGNIFADHAEAGVDFIATGGGDITTGLNSIITGGDIIINVDNIVDLGNSSAGGLIDVAGSQIDYVSLTAGGTIDLLARITGNTVRGDGNITGVTTSAGGGASSMTAETGSIALTGSAIIGGSLSLDAAGSISLTSGDIQGGALSAAAGQSIAFDQVSVAGNADFLAGTSIDFTSIDAGGDVSMIASSGGVTGSSISAAGSVTISADQAIVLNTLSAASAALQSVNGAISVDTDIILDDLLVAQGSEVFLRSAHDLAVQADANSGTVDIETTGDLDVRGSTAPGNISLVSTGGSVTVSQQVNSSGGDIVISAVPDVTVLADVIAAGSLQIDASGLVDIQAVASGILVDIISADIAVGSDAAIGQSDRTTGITFTANADEAVLGGAGGVTGVYELDNDEFSRVFSGGIVTLNAVGSSTGGSFVTIDDLDVVAGVGSDLSGSNIGQDGGLVVIAGDIAVEGSLSIKDATSATFVELDALNLITVDYEAGNIGITDTDGLFGGTVSLIATSVEAISDSARSDISGLSLPEVDERLGQNDGLVRPDGFFQAGTILFEVGESLLIQNTGAGTAFDDRRGFVADSVIVVGNSSTDPVDIVINGIVADETGVEALALIDLTDVDPAAQSTINGCLIADPSTCVNIIVDPEFDDPNDSPIRELIEDQIEPDSPAGDTIVSMVVEFRTDPERSPDPLLDEPVTGAGNEDFWFIEAEKCEQGDAEQCPAE